MPWLMSQFRSCAVSPRRLWAVRTCIGVRYARSSSVTASCLGVSIAKISSLATSRHRGSMTGVKANRRTARGIETGSPVAVVPIQYSIRCGLRRSAALPVNPGR